MEQAEQLVQRVNNLLDRVQYLDYALVAYRDGRGAVYLQGVYDDADIYTGKVEVQRTRRWFLSPEMTDSEIVATAFKLCLTSAEHRCREAFKYKGARIFGPHFNVEDLAELCYNGREDAGGRRRAEVPA